MILWIDEIKITKISNKDYIEKYGSLFDEFDNEKKLIHFIYYPIFTLRSLTFAISQIYLSQIEYLHRGLNLGFSLFLLVYLVVYRPFKLKSILISNIASEIFNSFIMIIIFLKSFFGFLRDGDFFDFCFIGTVYIQILLQYVIVIYLFIENLIDRFKNSTRHQTDNITQTCSNLNGDSNLQEFKS